MKRLLSFALVALAALGIGVFGAQQQSQSTQQSQPAQQNPPATPNQGTGPQPHTHGAATHVHAAQAG